MILANDIEPNYGLYVGITKDQPCPEQDISAPRFNYIVNNVACTLYGECIQAMACDVHALTVLTQADEAIVHRLMAVGKCLGTLASTHGKGLLKSILRVRLNV